MKIGNKKIGPREPCFLIAEIAQAHNGSIRSLRNRVSGYQRIVLGENVVELHFVNSRKNQHFGEINFSYKVSEK